MSLGKKILKTSVIFSILKYLSFFVGIGGQIFLARLIAPDFFVPFITAFAIVEIIYAFAGIGLNNVLLTYQREPYIFGTAFYIIGFLCIILLIISYAIANFFFTKDILFLLLLLAISKSIAMYVGIFATFLEKDFKHVLVGLLEIIAKVVSVVVAIYLAYLGIKTEVLVYKELIYSFLFSGALFLIVSKDIEYKFSFATAKKIFQFSYKFFLIRVLAVLEKNIPILFLGNFAGNASAYFERSYYLGGLSNAFLSPVNSKIAYAFYAKVKGELHRVKKGVQLNIFFTLRFIMPISIILNFFSQEIILFIYGDKWIGAAKYLHALAGSFLCLPLLAVLIFFMLSHDGIVTLFKNKLCSLSAILISIFLIYIFSLDLVYIAWAFSLITFVSFIYLLIITHIKLKLDLRYLFLKPIVLALTLSPILLLSETYWLITSFCFGIIYILILSLIERDTIKVLLNLLRNK